MRWTVVITCAVTGSADTVGKNPAVPVTPRQIAQSALEAADAGAAVVHIHVRDPETGKPSMAPELYRETVARIRDSGRDVVINLTTGPGARFVPGEETPGVGGPGTTLARPEARVSHIEALRPEICSLDMGSLNFGPTVFVNTPGHLSVMAKRIAAAGVKPELEVFEAGHIRLAKDMIRRGEIASPPFFQICLGIPWGAPATAETLVYLRDQLPADAAWSAFAIGAMQFPFAAQSAIAGGHVRVGLEDNLHLEKGVPAPSNASLVERTVSILSQMGVTPATPAQARDLLQLPSPR